MSLRDKPHYTVTAETLARWIENQPDRWWLVDGDPRLTSEVYFPCPSDELAPAIRRIGKNVLVYDRAAESTAHGAVIDGAQLDRLADVSNRLRQKTFLFSWQDSELDWLLIEDEAFVER